MLVLGRLENLLLWHPDVSQFDTIDELVAYLSGVEDES